jgi:hypothetical protein
MAHDGKTHLRLFRFEDHADRKTVFFIEAVDEWDAEERMFFMKNKPFKAGYFGPFEEDNAL